MVISEDRRVIVFSAETEAFNKIKNDYSEINILK